MHIAIVKVIIIAGKILAAIIWQGKVMEISFRQAYLPVQVVGLMVAHNGGKGDAVYNSFHTVKLGLPLGMVFAIVHDVAHIDEKGCIRIELRCGLGQIFPVAVIAGLGIGKYQAFKSIGSGSFEAVPIAGILFRYQPVFVVRFRGEVIQPAQILQVLCSVVGKKVLLSGNRQGIVLPFKPVFHLGLGKPAVCLHISTRLVAASVVII